MTLSKSKSLNLSEIIEYNILKKPRYGSTAGLQEPDAKRGEGKPTLTIVLDGSVAFTFQLKQISLSTTRTKAYLLMVLRMSTEF